MTHGSPSRSPSLARYLVGLARCVRVSPDLVAALAPVGWPRFGERMRHQHDLDVERQAWHAAAIHATWADFAGAIFDDDDAFDVDDEVMARRGAALEALADVSAEIDRALDVLAEPRRETPDEVRSEAWLIVGLAAPLRLPVLVATLAAERFVSSAGPVPRVDRGPAPPNLLTDVLVEALPGLLASAAARHLVRAIPRPLSIGLRVGKMASTILVDRGRVEVRNGLEGNVALLLHGGIEPILRRVSGRLDQEAAGLSS